MLHSKDPNYLYENFTLKVPEEASKIQHDEIIEFIKKFFSDKEGPAIVGISGGKDSTVCAALLAEALGPERVIGVQMPNGEQKDLADSDKVIKTLGIKHFCINIGHTYKTLTATIADWLDNSIEEIPDLYTTNTPARLRMVTLYGVAAMYKGFVCNTCNLSEDWVGYSTKWGDAVGDFSLLSRLTKTEVVALGDYMKLPEDLIHKTPSDGMCGKSDEDKMGFTYEELDFYLNCTLGDAEKVLSKEVMEKIDKMHSNPNTGYKIVKMLCAPGTFPGSVVFTKI